MSDHDTLSPGADAELRARLRAYADEVQERVDAEAALERMPKRSRPPTMRLVAIAACFAVAVGVAAAVMADRQSVDTVPPAESPTTECPTTSQPRALTPGGQMKMRFGTPVASAATAILLISACGDDDGPTTLAKGEDIELVGSVGLASQTLNIDARLEDGQVTGEFRTTENVHAIECADTDTDGLIILGGSATDGPDVEVGDLLALVIREGDPDSVYLVGNDVGAESCTELVDSITDEALSNESNYVDVEDGYDIETG